MCVLPVCIPLYLSHHSHITHITHTSLTTLTSLTHMHYTPLTHHSHVHYTSLTHHSHMHYTPLTSLTHALHTTHTSLISLTRALHTTHTSLTHTLSCMHTNMQAKLAFERLEVEKKYHPFIISQAKALSDQTGTRINIPPPSVDRADITVAGEKEGVAKAVGIIKALYEELVSDADSLLRQLDVVIDF